MFGMRGAQNFLKADALRQLDQAGIAIGAHYLPNMSI